MGEERVMSSDMLMGMKQAMERRDEALARSEDARKGVNEQLDEAKREINEYREQMKELVSQQEKLVGSLKLEIEAKEKEFNLLTADYKSQIKILEEKLSLNECGK